MPYFISDTELSKNKEFSLNPEEARHIIVSKRAQNKERIIVQDPNENRFLCEIVSINKKNLVLKALSPITPPKEPDIKITLCQAYISEQNLDFILAKATELGATEIAIFQAEFSPNNLKEKSEKKLTRWQKITAEAAKQSERIRPPKITIHKDLLTTLEYTNKIGKRIFLDTLKTASSASNNEIKQFALFVGPEGGFSEKERKLAKNTNNLQGVSLGERILKAETAAIAGLTLLQYNYGDLKTSNFMV